MFHSMPIVIFHVPPSELPIVNIVQIAKPLSEKKKKKRVSIVGH